MAVSKGIQIYPHGYWCLPIPAAAFLTQYDKLKDSSFTCWAFDHTRFRGAMAYVGNLVHWLQPILLRLIGSAEADSTRVSGGTRVSPKMPAIRTVIFGARPARRCRYGGCNRGKPGGDLGGHDRRPVHLHHLWTVTMWASTHPGLPALSSRPTAWFPLPLTN